MNNQKKLAFNNAILEFVRQETQNLDESDEICYKRFMGMQLQRYHGIWQKISSICSIEVRKCHDYYHNTWCLRFYEQISPYRKEIRFLIQELVAQKGYHENLANEVKNIFLQRYKSKNFNNHSVSQTILTLITRLKKRTSASPSSVSYNSDFLTSTSLLVMADDEEILQQFGEL